MSEKPCCKCGTPVDIPEEVETLVSGLGEPLCRLCLDLLLAERHDVTTQEEVKPRETKYAFTPDMDEISGFGGGYEQTCRNMVSAGVEWFDKHPNAEPLFKGFKQIYGVISEENAAAKLLTRAVVEASGNNCTGAMHQATIGHILWIRENGWERYCTESRERFTTEQKEKGNGQ